MNRNKNLPIEGDLLICKNSMFDTKIMTGYTEGKEYRLTEIRWFNIKDVGKRKKYVVPADNGTRVAIGLNQLRGVFIIQRLDRSRKIEKLLDV